MLNAKKTTVFLLAVLILSGAFAEEASGAKSSLEQGIVLYGKSDYRGALESFRKILTDPGAGAQMPDAFYFSALCYMGSGDYENAAKTAEAYMKTWPEGARTSDVRYQYGRIKFLQRDYESGVKAFYAFIDSYPAHEYYPAALYWAAECLFQLGRINDSERLFRLVAEKFPKSVKYEASQFRLSLIDLKYREDEILKLLKWSHEEALKAVEEYQKRERTYEQAISVLQKRVADMTAGKYPAQTQDTQAIQTLQAKIAELEKTVAERDKTVATLQSRVQAATPSGQAATRNQEGLLAVKAQALELKQYYLSWLLDNIKVGGK